MRRVYGIKILLAAAIGLITVTFSHTSAQKSPVKAISKARQMGLKTSSSTRKIRIAKITESSVVSPPSLFSTPPETLLCDNGDPVAAGANGQITWKEAVRLTPSTQCYLTALLFWPLDPDTESPNLTWGVWDDDDTLFQGFPSTLLETGTVVPVYDNWFQIDLPSPIFIDSGDIYIGWLDANGAPFYWNAFDDTLGSNNCNYWFNGTDWVFDDWFPGDFLVRGICNALNDGGVVSFESPSIVCTGDTISVCVTVENFGTVSDTIQVISTINGYTDTSTIPDVPPGTTDSICFDWIVPLPGSTSYTLVSCAEVTDDTIASNNCDSTSLLAIVCSVRDGGVIAIQAPDTVCTDSTESFCITVQNFGDPSETFNVISTIDGFTDTSEVLNLDPGDTTSVCFNWTAPGTTGTFTLTSCTMISSDSNPSNDCDSSSFVTAVCPVGIEESPERISVTNPVFLSQNEPNPFHQLTAISYQLRAQSQISLKVYDITGRLVETLVDEEQEPGEYHIPISNHQLPGSGIYFYRLESRTGQSQEIVKTRKMTLLR
jgi:hypothetical protein